MITFKVVYVYTEDDHLYDPYKEKRSERVVELWRDGELIIKGRQTTDCSLAEIDGYIRGVRSLGDVEITYEHIVDEDRYWNA